MSDYRGLSIPTVTGLKRLDQEAEGVPIAPVGPGMGGRTIDPRATVPVGQQGLRVTPEQAAQLQQKLRLQEALARKLRQGQQ